MNPEISPMTNLESELMREATRAKDAARAPSSPARNSTSPLIPYFAALTLISAAIVVPPSVAWDSIVMLQSGPLGSTLLAIAATLLVCGSLAAGMIWWFCQPTSQHMTRRMPNAHSTAVARRKMRSTHAA